MHTVSLHLTKKVIYIDQFALSYMVRALHPGMKATGNDHADQFWVKMYQKLDQLVKLQMIVCLQSDFHFQESVVSNFFEPLEKMYHLLSGGTRFIDSLQIKNFQMKDSVRNWLKGLSGNLEVDSVRKIINKEINAWNPKSKASNLTQLQYPSIPEDELRKSRERIHQQWLQEFHFWKEHVQVKFEQWMEDFYLSLFEKIVHFYPETDDLSSMDFTLPRIHRVSLVDFLLESWNPIQLIHSVLREEGILQHDLWSKTRQYLQSGCLKQMPFIKLYALFYASLARKAGSGQKKPPGRGITNDLHMLSLLLPYCDAMFIDNQCHGFLEEKEFQDRIDGLTRIFSLSSKEEFLAYLDQLERAFPAEYREEIVARYGEEWINTPTKLYGNDES